MHTKISGSVHVPSVLLIKVHLIIKYHIGSQASLILTQKKPSNQWHVFGNYSVLESMLGVFNNRNTYLTAKQYHNLRISGSRF